MVFSNSHKARPDGRVMVIGLDGVTFDLIEPWARAGHLPNLARLMEQGAWTRLMSTIPAHSGPAWASFMTGTLPGKHGVYHFVGPSRDENYFRPLSGDSVRGRRFWEVAGDQERSVGVVNVPLTFPPRPVNGYMIAGLFAPNGSGAFQSKELYEEVVAHCGEYIVNAPVVQSREGYLQGLLDGMAGRLQVGEYLLDNHPTDLFIIVFRMIDSIMHRYWADMDEQHPLHKELGDSAVPDGILRGYKLLDNAVGRLMAKAPSDTTFFILSDHGFIPLYRRFAGNAWLRENGLLALRSGRATITSKAEEWAERLHLEMALKAVGKRVLRLMGEKSRYEGWLYQGVDWAHTRAVFGPNTGVNINLKGRDFYGTVEPSEYESLRDWIITEMKAMRDPETGLNVFRNVYRREEVYFGDALELAPDITFEMGEYETNGKRWSYIVAPGFSERKRFPPPSRRLPAEHAADGIFLAYGPHIQSGKYSEFSIVDVAPTVLYSMGLQIPAAMDGVARTELFDSEFTRDNPVITTDIDLSGSASGQALAGNYDSVVTERLRDLGYIE